MARQRRKKHTRLVHSQFAVFLERLLKARTRPPVSDGEMVFSSTKITPPCSRSSSAQAFSKGGIVLRSKDDSPLAKSLAGIVLRSKDDSPQAFSKGGIVLRS